MARFSSVHADTSKQVWQIGACCLWLTGFIGEELCINYVVDQCGFPGMPWAVRPIRQQRLLDGYRFTCCCPLCTGAVSAPLESALCAECSAEAKGGESGVVCVACGHEWDCEEVPGLTAGAKVPGAPRASPVTVWQVVRLTSMWFYPWTMVQLGLIVVAVGMRGLLIRIHKLRKWLCPACSVG